MDKDAPKRTRAFLDPSVERKSHRFVRPKLAPVGYRRVRIGFEFRP
jgi:hypothetical protein